MLLLLYDNVTGIQLHDVILIVCLVERNGPLVVVVSAFESRDFVLATSQNDIMRVKELASLNMTNDNRLIYAPELERWCVVRPPFSNPNFIVLVYLHHHIAHRLRQIEEPSKHRSHQTHRRYRNN